MARQKAVESAQYSIQVPLDASGVEGIEPDQEVKVVVRDGGGGLRSQTVRFGRNAQATTQFAFEDHPGSVRVMVGPADASDEEIVGLQTIAVDVAPRQWRGEKLLQLSPIVVSPYYWRWWLRWCRTYTINGVLRCPDGRPVPGAEVCAYDVDWWWMWTSQELVGCATTDVNGAFQITFRWCCGWWPWWWWRLRYWRLEPDLVDLIQPVLRKDPSLDRLMRPSAQPSFAGFEALLLDDGAFTPASAEVDPIALAGLREALLPRLPFAPELEQRRIWPWAPWFPWWDCSPDIVFRATQECAEGGVVLDETFSDARWNIPTTLDVSLVASENACCVLPPPGCDEGECTTITEVCGHLLDTIGGNLTCPSPTPVGYQNPNVASIHGDRPFAGFVDIHGTADCMAGVDYYEFEWATSAAGPWNTMPPAAAGDISHSYVQFSPLAFASPTFSPAVPIGGRHVYETLAHFEATHDPVEWTAGNRVWVGSSRDWLTRWRTDGNFADGAYYLRVVGWDLVAPGVLGNPRVLPICESEEDNFVVLRVDNRVLEGTGPLDLRGHPCGTGTVHTCTAEPEAAILAVAIVRPDGTEVPVAACGNVGVEEEDYLQVDFVAHDPNGHLGRYTLHATYDVNLSTNLLGLGGTLAPSPLAPAWAPAAVQVGPTYGDARSANPPPLGGAVAPTWHGGAIRLTVKAADVFPYTCCYQLELRSHKRTIVNCDNSDWGHTNFTEYSFNIVV